MSRKPYAMTVRSLRESRGYTQEQLAALAKTSPRTIRAIEKGHTSPGAVLLIRILDVLKADREQRAVCMGG